MSDTKQRALVSTFVVFAIVIATIRVLYVSRELDWLAPYIPALVAIVLIYVPVVLARRRQESLSYLDRTANQWWTSIKLFIIVSVIILPPYLLLHHAWQLLIYGSKFQLRPPVGLFWMTVDQLFLVAIPEEIFFRGWLQSRFNRAFPAKWRIFSVQVGWGWLLTAIFFALAHSLITYQWWHFAIFFPALVFGWMREKSGTIMGPALFHCACNLTAYWIGFLYT